MHPEQRLSVATDTAEQCQCAYSQLCLHLILLRHSACVIGGWEIASLFLTSWNKWMWHFPSEGICISEVMKFGDIVVIGKIRYLDVVAMSSWAFCVRSCSGLWVWAPVYSKVTALCLFSVEQLMATIKKLTSICSPWRATGSVLRSKENEVSYQKRSYQPLGTVQEMPLCGLFLAFVLTFTPEPA